MKWYKKLHNKLENKDSTMENLFANTAKEIMNNYLLNINNFKIELTEIEFYYFNCDTHDDHYVHIDRLQKESCDFLYVHKKSYPRGRIDITFGNQKFYGGILIRGIKINNIFVAGSATIKQYIMDIIPHEATNYELLQKYFNDNKKNIFLSKKENTNYDIYCSNRIGLNKEVDERYYNAKYRFVRADYLEQKNKQYFKSYTNLKERTKLTEKV